jgi:D-3-phosphoglycerate dehydrogenase / 2-oxoglutarate reductase
MAPKVLVADKLSRPALEIFARRGIDAHVKTDLPRDALIEIIPDYDGLAVRSATKVTEKVVAAGERLKVIGRAGIGVDNVDLKAATSRGIIVMNTPFGNAITTAEHAIALMLALARQVPLADLTTRAGKWAKSELIGVEITGKCLGIIGCGNIGAIVADRAHGLKMKVVVFDPYLSPERATDLCVEKVELDALFRRADFITLHTPLTDKTRKIVNAEAIRTMRDGVRIINCARGGLIDERALFEALQSGKVAGAAIDVFEVEPATDNILFSSNNVICTPHLGASTREAQENVAIQIAEQISDFLLDGAITNALNFPSISAEERPKLMPFLKLAEQLGSFAGQTIEAGLKSVRIEYAGAVADLNTKALTAAALSGVLTPFLEQANMVSAPGLAKERGIMVEEVTRGQQGAYETYIWLRVGTEFSERSVAGTVFSDGKPRLVQVGKIAMEAELGPHMLYTENADKPGYVGALGTALGAAQMNIATFSLGRSAPGGTAIALLELDQPIPDDLLEKINALPHVTRAERLFF